MVWGPPLILLSLMATVSFHIGLMGADFLDASREWLARIWRDCVACQCQLGGIFSHFNLRPVCCRQAWLELWRAGNSTHRQFGLRVQSFGVKAGTGDSSPGKPGEPEKPGIKDSLTRLAPAVFMIGLLILIAGGVHYTLGSWATGIVTASR